MPQQISYNLTEPATPGVTPGAAAEQGVTTPLDSFLGFGLIRPFVRDAADFAKAGGFLQVRSSVGQILGTKAQSERTAGELPWRPDFGSKLYLIRHRKGPIVEALARSFIREALDTWEPRVEIVEVTTEFDRETRVRNIRVRLRVIDQNVAGNNVVLPDEVIVTVEDV